MVATAPLSTSPMTVQSSVAETQAWWALMRRSLPVDIPVRRKAMPWLAGAGCSVISTGFPEWTPMPLRVAGALSVVCWFVRIP